MGRADYYAPGDYNASCFECGRKFKASELKRHWKGYYVCKDHWEVRQPQDFARTVPDIQTVAWSQPEVTDKFAWESAAGLITSDTVLGSSASTVTVGDASGVTITITLPAAPITNQIITVDNIGAGVVVVVGAAVPVNAAAYTTAWFVWDGYTWGYITGMFCDAVVLPQIKDFGVVQYAGPAETAYGVPQTTVEYEDIGYTPCGGLLRKVVTKSYAGRSVLPRATTGYPNAGDYPDPIHVNGITSPTLHANGAAALVAFKDYADANFTWADPWTREYLGSEISSANSYAASFRGVDMSITYATLIIYLGNPAYYLDVHEVWTYEII